MISIFISHGFAYRVTWEGKRGRDQFGDIWIQRDGYASHAENLIVKFKL